jgi:hypothetical protein
MRALGVASLISLACAPALAAAPPAWVAERPPTTVAPLTVAPHGDAPKIVSSFPAAGQVIAPGSLVLRITFDQKMDEHDFGFAAAAGGKMPDCLKTPRLLKDEKTFVLLCTTRRDTSYALAFNANPKGGGFASIGGAPAAPATLAFATNAQEDGPRDLAAAMKAASLTDADVPIAVSP